MLYRPVKVHQIISVEYKKANKPWNQFAVGRQDGIPTTYRKKDGTLMVATGREKRYWVVSCNLFGECSHKHKTEAGAEACALKVKKRWHEHRSKQAKAAAKKRKSWVTRMAGQRLEGIGAVLVD
jgi:hypothetical protein